jgi:RHS repeat-associated protein
MGDLIRSNNAPVILDRLGSVRAWIDQNQNINTVQTYPFGEERKCAKGTSRKFGTYLRDEFSQLDYAEQRYYSSALGRFITPDPFQGSIILGNPDSWNRYAYVLNDPINYSDPHGLYPYSGIAGWWSRIRAWYWRQIVNPNISNSQRTAILDNAVQSLPSLYNISCITFVNNIIQQLRAAGKKTRLY